MLNLQDERWNGLAGGHRIAFDPRPLLSELANSPTSAESWDALIANLYHQGDVGDASYASVPHLAGIGVREDVLPWQLLALVSFIELARTSVTNPPIPDWLESDYRKAIQALAIRSLAKIVRPNDPEQLRGMLSIISLWKGLRVYASVISDYSEEELQTLLPRALESW